MPEDQPILEFAFNSYLYSLPCTEDESLLAILKHIRVALNLPDSLELKARAESSRTFLPEALKLSEFLPMLGENRRLEVCIDNLSAYPAAHAKDGTEDVRVSSKDQAQAKRSGRIVGHIEGHFESEIYHRQEKYFVMPYQTLRQLQEHLKNDFATAWTNRLCGAMLGATITIVVTLQNNSISEMFRSNLKISLTFCLFILIVFALFEKFGRPKDRRFLESLISSLLREDEHHV